MSLPGIRPGRKLHSLSQKHRRRQGTNLGWVGVLSALLGSRGPEPMDGEGGWPSRALGGERTRRLEHRALTTQHSRHLMPHCCGLESSSCQPTAESSRKPITAAVLAITRPVAPSDSAERLRVCTRKQTVGRPPCSLGPPLRWSRPLRRSFLLSASTERVNVLQPSGFAPSWALMRVPYMAT